MRRRGGVRVGRHLVRLRRLAARIRFRGGCRCVAVRFEAVLSPFGLNVLTMPIANAADGGDTDEQYGAYQEFGGQPEGFVRFFCHFDCAFGVSGNAV